MNFIKSSSTLIIVGDQVEMKIQQPKIAGKQGIQGKDEHVLTLETKIALETKEDWHFLS